MDRLDGILQDLRQAARSDGTPQLPEADATGEKRTRPAARPAQTKPAAPRRAGRSSAPTNGRKRWLLIAGAVIVALLAVSIIGGALSGSAKPVQGTRTPPHSIPAPTAPVVNMHKTPSPLQWQPVIEQLDLRRGRMFMDQGNYDVLTVDQVSSPAFNTDQMLLQRLQKAKAHLRSYPMHVISVAEEYSTVGEKQARALLTIVDELGAYDIVDARGKVLQHVPARGRTTWKVEVRNTVWGWVYFSAIRAATK